MEYFSSAAAYYSDVKKHESDGNAKAWKTLSAEEKKPYIRMFDDVKILREFNRGKISRFCLG